MKKHIAIISFFQFSMIYFQVNLAYGQIPENYEKADIFELYKEADLKAAIKDLIVKTGGRNNSIYWNRFSLEFNNIQASGEYLYSSKFVEVGKFSISYKSKNRQYKSDQCRIFVVFNAFDSLNGDHYYRTTIYTSPRWCVNGENGFFADFSDDLFIKIREYPEPVPPGSVIHYGDVLDRSSIHYFKGRGLYFFKNDE